MEVIKRVHCELNASLMPCVEVALNDSLTRKLVCQLMADAQPWTVPEGVRAGIGYELADGRNGYYEILTDGSDACEISGNEVSAVIAPVMTSVAGITKAAIILRQGGKQLSTFHIAFRVAERPGHAVTPGASPDAASPFVGKLYYGGKNGVPVPLAVGGGLAVEDGTLSVPDAVGKEYVDAAVEALWAEIRYVPIAISNFRRTPSVVALGTVLQSVTLAWSLNKEPTVQKLNGTLLMDSARSVEQPGPFTETTNFTLAVTDEREAADTASAKVYFYNHVYYGFRAGRGMPVDGELYQMDSKLQDSLGLTINAAAGDGEYVLYACPSRLGTPEFWCNGLRAAMEKIGTMAHANANGYRENYDVWISEADALAGVDIIVK